MKQRHRYFSSDYILKPTLKAGAGAVGFTAGALLGGGVGAGIGAVGGYMGVGYLLKKKRKH